MRPPAPDMKTLSNPPRAEPAACAALTPLCGTHGNSAPLGRLERLPKWLNLVPIVTQWLWLALRYRSVTLPSSANPAITTGGMVGEGKMEYLDIMGPRARAATVATTSLRVQGPASADDAEAAMAASGLRYPVVLKPDLGWCGFGVRRVDSRAQLLAYLARFPPGERVVVQRFMPDEGEAGLFYLRQPGQAQGRVIGLLLRHYPRVVGDGRRSVAELMAADARLRRLGQDGLSEPLCDPAMVPAAGQTVRLATVGSTRVGGLYRDGSRLVTPALSQAIDEIARDMTDFHVGRFDVKFRRIAALRAGEGFRIIEVNGAGSEAVHAWDPALTLGQAYGIIFDKQRQLFAVGDAMRARGHRPVGLRRLARLHFGQQALIRRYPPSN